MPALLRLVTSAPALLTYTIRSRSTGETRTVIGEAALSQALTVAAPAKGAIVIRDIPEKSYTRGGKVYPREPRIGHHAEIVPGKSIRLFGIETNRVAGPVNYDDTYKVGDACVTGAFNTVYFGTITAIGKSTVHGEVHHRPHEAVRPRRLLAVERGARPRSRSPPQCKLDGLTPAPARTGAPQRKEQEPMTTTSTSGEHTPTEYECPACATVYGKPGTCRSCLDEIDETHALIEREELRRRLAVIRARKASNK